MPRKVHLLGLLSVVVGLSRDAAEVQAVAVAQGEIQSPRRRARVVIQLETFRAYVADVARGLSARPSLAVGVAQA